MDQWQRYVHYLYKQFTSGISMPVIATGPQALETADDLWWTWTGARRLVRPGINGADDALLEVLQEPLASRVDHIEIWSGDHAFTPAARNLRTQNIPVTVLACPGTIARCLFHAATNIRQLNELASFRDHLAIDKVA